MGCAGCKVRQVEAAVKEPLPASLAKAPRGRFAGALPRPEEGRRDFARIFFADQRKIFFLGPNMTSMMPLQPTGGPSSAHIGDLNEQVVDKAESLFKESLLKQLEQAIGPPKQELLEVLVKRAMAAMTVWVNVGIDFATTMQLMPTNRPLISLLIMTSLSIFLAATLWEGVVADVGANRSHFLGKSAVEVTASGAKCGPIDLPENAGCKEVVEWAVSGGKNDPSAEGWYYNMPSISGVKYGQGTLADFQRLYYCAPPGKDKFCGLPPCTGCSNPPCNDCFAGHQLYASLRPGCDGNNRGLGCVPPKSAMGYKGQHWPTSVIYGTQEMHIFAIGDWGGMDGSLDTNEGRPNIVAYDWGKRPGPSVFPRSRWNKAHTVKLCGHKQLVQCFNTRGQPPCIPECGYVPGVDDNPQILVANAFKARAALKDPSYILNVGDNFYWGGIEKTCGEPMNKISYPTKHQFDQIFEGVYQGAGLSGKPWFSVLGNHDWGGFKFDNGWDQQMSYTWASDRWVMPAPYYSTTVVYADLGFDVDYYFLDSNFMDAKTPEEDPNHNMCSRKNNKPSATCAAADGPTSVDTCPGWFAALWAEQKEWVTRLLPKSQATWQIAVTHFPCGHEQGFYKSLANMGLDLLVTGHRHDQELWLPDDYAKNHMGITCIVTGGGGGITSEATPDPDHTEDWYGEAQYGFYDLTISKKEIFIESVNYDGEVLLTHTVYPSR